MESEPSSTLKLPLLFSIPPKLSPEPSGMATPPLQTSASVPFRWEEEPGKPRPCKALILSYPDKNTPKSLELPPRLLMEPKITKTPSPTAVLDGPYVGKSTIFQSSSFRFIRDGQGSFRNCSSLSPEKGSLDRGLFGSWRLKVKVKGGKKEVGGGSFVFSPSMDIAEADYSGDGDDDDDDDESNSSVSSTKRVKRIRITRNGSFSTLSQSRPHFWSAIYKGFKQVIPWSRKSKKEGLII